MIYKGPGFLAVTWLGSSLAPFPHPSPVRKLSLFLSLPVCRRSSLQKIEKERWWRKSQNIRWRGREKALFSLNHSILSSLNLNKIIVANWIRPPHLWVKINCLTANPALQKPLFAMSRIQLKLFRRSKTQWTLKGKKCLSRKISYFCPWTIQIFCPKNLDMDSDSSKSLKSCSKLYHSCIGSLPKNLNT